MLAGTTRRAVTPALRRTAAQRQQAVGAVTEARAGYFVIIPDLKSGGTTEEHYAYDNRRQHVIEGTNSCDLYSTIIGAGWVSQLSNEEEQVAGLAFMLLLMTRSRLFGEQAASRT